MGVAAGTPVAGEMFDAGDDSLFVVLFNPDGGEMSYFVGVGGETAAQFADNGALGVDIDIDTGGEIEVDASFAEGGGDGARVAGDAVVAAAGGGFSGEGRGEAVAGAETGNIASFLVNAYKKGFGGVFLEVCTEVFDLLWRADVAVACAGRGVVFEENDTAHMVFGDIADYGVLFGDGGATKSHQ